MAVGVSRRVVATFAAVAGLALVGVGGAAAAPEGVVRVSSDPYSDPLAQHRTEVEPDTFAANGRLVGAFQVGRVFDGGATNIGWTSSLDGRRFASGFLPGITTAGGGPYARVTDPSVAYDAAHRVWMISSIPLTREPVHGPEVVVSRSTDGIHWANPVTVARAAAGADFDKNWTVCDNHRSSLFYGHCYTQFDDFGDVDRIKMSTSTDGGRTWGPALETVSRSLGLGGQPVVQPNGTVIVPIGDLTGVRRIDSFRSTDGGQSWSATTTAAQISHHTVAAGLRASPLASAEIDRDGKVFVVWEDCRFRPNCSGNDIVMSTTTDGIEWSPVVRIPIDPIDSGTDHFIPGLAVDTGSSGDHARLALTYYSYSKADCNTATCELSVGFISSRSGGAAWSTAKTLAGPMKVDWLANTSQGRMVGDYISTSFLNGRAFPLFAVAGPPTGGLFDEAMATVPGGLAVGLQPPACVEQRGNVRFHNPQCRRVIGRTSTPTESPTSASPAPRR